jgi:hypothetical protein
MKYIKYTGVTLIASCLLSVAIFTSCKKDFFEIKDTNGFEVVGSFEDEGAVGLFLNRTYALVIPLAVFTIHQMKQTVPAPLFCTTHLPKIQLLILAQLRV